MSTKALIEKRLTQPLSVWAKGDTEVVFTLDGRTFNYAQLMDKAAQAYRLISDAQAAAQKPLSLIAFHESSFEFCAVLLAANLSNATLIMPANAQSNYLSSLGVLADVAFVADQNVDALIESNCAKQVVGLESLGNSPIDRSIFEERALNLDAAVSLFTSGSTGVPSRIEKTWQQFVAEVDVLETQFTLGACAQIYATVSHQHIYGLLFRLVWPLLSGRVFQDKTHHYPEPVLSHLDQSALPAAMVSSPAQLKRWVDHEDFGLLKNSAEFIFSSGGPLALDTALSIESAIGFSPVEVYGSTETGGIAWRQQVEKGRANARWEFFPRVNFLLNEAGCLSVSSGFIYPSLSDDAGFFHTADRVELLGDGGFELKGRVDRIIKLEEKRLSLDDMENRLSAFNQVEEVKLLLIEGKQARQQLAAVVVLPGSVLGAKDFNKKQWVQTLKSYLSGYFEAVLLPRKWRFVERMPMNEQSKITQLSLQSLFD